MMKLTYSHLKIMVYAIFIAMILSLPLFLDEFWLNRTAKYLIYGMLGVAISLSWGYAGILNLGQGLFFGAGAYMLGMSLKLASPTSLEQGGQTPIPDFMMWNAEPNAVVDLCCINHVSFLWMPFQSQSFGIFMAIALPVLIAWLIGTIIFRKGIAGVFISIITLAMVLLARLLVVDAQSFTGGFNGLTDLAWFKINGYEFDPYTVSTYYLVAISLVIVLLITRVLINSRAGLILQAIRDDQNRAKYLGFDAASYQTFFFCVSAAISGFAGMLYVITAEFASPTFMDLSFSIAIVIWAAVGGRASILGACIGAISISMLGASVSENELFVESWQAILGLFFVLVVLYMPKGLAGIAHGICRKLTVNRGEG
ncbi:MULTISPECIES: urea ABC transporter permease subunit UrtC [Methylophaga]|uniref:urea ABC transporter permease subunit UrtC n=1 Tax=Methylophaga TaxID=40222 RepID=UPI002356A8CB|nr:MULTISPECIES: urea ABC transporter permease subunit UrtC [Methylophaga]